ncbi:Conserved_hypothetical protein [Hexamita inflata]|uniref:Uncharacterized protein n=1 Tax=Hexamita inflata TaxID=28002 RepID=A0AA86PUI7_9EUKA|nr:Conserved hypothetical protein [Hexamita inflata]CAI9964422.1 Conserved hypothetical protein [Hexamita inflata]
MRAQKSLDAKNFLTLASSNTVEPNKSGIVMQTPFLQYNEPQQSKIARPQSYKRQIQSAKPQKSAQSPQVQIIQKNHRPQFVEPSPSFQSQYLIPKNTPMTIKTTNSSSSLLYSNNPPAPNHSKLFQTKLDDEASLHESIHSSSVQKLRVIEQEFIPLQNRPQSSKSALKINHQNPNIINQTIKNKQVQNKEPVFLPKATFAPFQPPKSVEYVQNKTFKTTPVQNKTVQEEIINENAINNQVREQLKIKLKTIESSLQNKLYAKSKQESQNLEVFKNTIQRKKNLVLDQIGTAHEAAIREIQMLRNLRIRKIVDVTGMPENHVKALYGVQIDFHMIKALQMISIQLAAFNSLYILKGNTGCQGCMTYAGCKKSKIQQYMQTEKSLIKLENDFAFKSGVESTNEQSTYLTQASYIPFESVPERKSPTLGAQNHNDRFIIKPCGCSVCFSCKNEMTCPVCFGPVTGCVKSKVVLWNSGFFDQLQKCQQSIKEIVNGLTNTVISEIQ